MSKVIAILFLILACGSGQQATEHEDWYQNSSKSEGCWNLAPSTDDAGAAVPKQDEDQQTADSEFEFGQASEALTVPSGYGSDENSRRCSASSTKCKMPYSKIINFQEFLDTTCTGLLAPRYHASFVLATNYWKPLLEARGWTVYVNAGLPAHPENRIFYSVNCSASSTPIATTTLTFDHASGRNFFTSQALTRLDQADIESSAFVGTTLTKQKNFISSVMIHEMGHVLGLGHYVPAVACPDRRNPSDTVMVNAGCGDPLDATTYVVRTAATDELKRIADYRP